MASTFTPLGVELQATGENAGTWGTKTNTNLQLIEQISGGFTQQSIAGGAQTTTLSVSDGSTGAVLSHRMIEFTGTITGNQVVTIPLDVQQFYFLRNSTSGSHTVQFKYVSGSGDSFTFSATDKGDKLIFASASDGTNPNIISLAFGPGSLSNVSEDTTPQLGGDLDVNGNDIVSTSNADIDIIPNGTGDINLGADTVQVGDNDANATITTQGTGDLILNTNNGTNAGNITLADGANGDITISPNGTGQAKAVDAADATGSIKIAGKETIWVPAVAMYPNSTNGAEAEQVELSNGPEIKTLDFDKDSDEFAQFAVAFPKSWNAGTVTFQAFFTATSTDTGTTAWGLSAVALADNGDLNTAFGTQVVATAKAHSGTSNDLDVASESGAVTIAGSPGADEYVFFQISRDVSADDLNADARLLGIKLFFTTSAANDA